MGKIEMTSQFRRSSSSKSRSSGFPAPTTEEEMERVFREFDPTGDGRISRPELAALFGHAPADEELFRMFDADRRIVSRKDLAALFGHVATAEELSGMFDANGDGKISQLEMSALIGHAAAADELSGTMAEGDVGDGFNSLDEAAEEEDVEVPSDRVVINIDDELGTSNGGGGGVMRVSAAEENNGEEERTKKLSLIVRLLGGVSDSAATAVAMYTSPRSAATPGGEVAYRVCIASVAQTLAAFWVSNGPQTPGARAAGKKILYVSIGTLILSVALDCASPS